MAYRMREKMGVNVLQFDGDFKTEEMVQLKSRLGRLLKKNRKKLLLNLEQTRRLELAAIGILVDRLRIVRAVKGDIKICNIQPEVKRALEMIGVSGLIESFRSEEEAIRSFATSSRSAF